MGFSHIRAFAKNVHWGEDSALRLDWLSLASGVDSREKILDHYPLPQYIIRVVRFS
jgi:hypothetical protein